MRIRFQPLATLRISPGFAPAQQPYNGLVVEPLPSCTQLMQRFAWRHHSVSSGIQLFYQTQPVDGSTSPLRPVALPQVFRFRVRATDPALVALAQIDQWGGGRAFILRNATYHATGTTLIHNGPLTAPATLVPLQHKLQVPLHAAPGWLRLRNAAGAELQGFAVRALLPDDPPGATTEIMMPLYKWGEGEYTATHEHVGPHTTYRLYATEDYRPDVLAIIELTYATGAAYTGMQPQQEFLVQIAPRQANWRYRIHISEANRVLYPAHQLGLVHRVSGGDAPHTFSVEGPVDAAAGIVQFRSDAPIPFSHTPVQVDLVRLPATVVLPALPMPSAGHLIRDGSALVPLIFINI
jgi:hypothetical protein